MELLKLTRCGSAKEATKSEELINGMGENISNYLLNKWMLIFRIYKIKKHHKVSVHTIMNMIMNDHNK